ncbi:MAG: arsenate reductase ArsC [Planctomycetota bacterium]|jgi:arsenate reductase
MKVLFLCTGNSCRSQIAEAWARQLKSVLVEPYSAGIRPSAVNPRAAKVMAEEEIDISSQTSRHVDELLGTDFDYVVTLCDNARDNCPVFTGNAKLIHRVFEDPTLVIGSEEKILAAFRKTRDNIKAFIETLPESLENKSA